MSSSLAPNVCRGPLRPRNRSATAVVAVAFLLAVHLFGVPGCAPTRQEAVEGETHWLQCTTQQECEVCNNGGCRVPDGTTEDPCEDGACAASPWVCFQERCVPEPLATLSECELPNTPLPEVVEFALPVTSWSDGEALSRVTAMACNATDVICEEPITTVQANAGPDESTVMLRMSLPGDFRGSLQIESDFTVPFAWQLRVPVAHVVPQKLRLFSRSGLDAIARVGRIPLDTDLGLVMLQAQDCAGRARSGVHFVSSDANGIPFYLTDLLPNLSATETEANERTNTASGGFFNAAPGFQVVQATSGVGGPMFAVHNAVVRPAAITYVVFQADGPAAP